MFSVSVVDEPLLQRPPVRSWSQLIHRSGAPCWTATSVGGEQSALSTDSLRLQVDSLAASDVRPLEKPQKYGGKSTKTWRWRRAVRAGSLPPNSGASFFIHGETVREAWLSIGPGGLLLFEQKLSPLACSHASAVCLRSGAAPPDHCSSSPTRRLCFVSVVFFPFFSPGCRFPPRIGSRCPPPQTDPRMLLALKW